jgi:dTDP-4-dehydrorhamnose reductase
MTNQTRCAPIEWWGGVECTVNRVGGHWFDQLRWSGHEWRDDDLERFATLGISAIRYPVLWERLAPASLDEIDWRWTDRRLARLKDLGIRPIVGLLHHGSGPTYTSLLDSAFPDKLARFADAVARRYPWITAFTPINEPLTTARFSALYGHWYPHERSDAAFIRALTNQLRGVVLAMQAIRRVVPDARLVQTEDSGKVFGTAATASQVAHENHRRWLTWDLLTGAVGRVHPLFPFLRRSGFDAEDEAFFRNNVCPPDIVGLNYYLTSDRYLDARISSFPEHTHGGNARMRYADVEAVRGLPQGIAGHEAHLTEAWERYRIPVALTEVHLACTREEQLRWLAEAWTAAQSARANGADVTAVTAWALLGSYNWNSLVTTDTGHYEPGVFDVRGPSPRRTAVGRLIAALAAGQTAAHPLFDVAGWWRRPERLTLGTGRAASALLPTKRPMLIIGGTGTLGRAFQRICALRGLPVQAVGRTELDITDPAAIDDLIGWLQPWAIVNAAGYVRVDEAEGDPELCLRVNATGPAHLAAVCERRGLPLITYSSDLVFDGTKGRCYDETDVPLPLNVYGASKAEAERAVLALLPQALVIRTSAFFGPWDSHNFLAHLFAALDRGETFRAADDAVVSPTYVPDLVHASLDLLIDEECGIWHLVNDGAMSWYDFAMLAAVRSGRRLDLIAPVSAAALIGAAARPAFTGLTSCRGQLLRPVDTALAALFGEMHDHEVEAPPCASR